MSLSRGDLIIAWLLNFPFFPTQRPVSHDLSLLLLFIYSDKHHKTSPLRQLIIENCVVKEFHRALLLLFFDVFRVSRSNDFDKGVVFGQLLGGRERARVI
jgi:hypothetical protein